MHYYSFEMSLQEISSVYFHASESRTRTHTTDPIRRFTNEFHSLPLFTAKAAHKRMMVNDDVVSIASTRASQSLKIDLTYISVCAERHV